MANGISQPFRKRLDDNQVRIKSFSITFYGKDKLQFYLKQMYASNHFDKKEMTEWENKPKATKDNFNKSKIYFEVLVRDYKVYEQNSSSTANKYNFVSANQATKADCSDKLCQYIAGFAQAAETQEDLAANIRDRTKALTDAMALQIKTISDQIAQPTKAMANKQNVSSGGGGGNGSGHGGGKDKGRAKRKIVQYTKPCNMGCYCLLHCFHQAGKNHTSATCQW